MPISFGFAASLQFVLVDESHFIRHRVMQHYFRLIRQQLVQRLVFCSEQAIQFVDRLGRPRLSVWRTACRRWGWRGKLGSIISLLAHLLVGSSVL